VPSEPAADPSLALRRLAGHADLTDALAVARDACTQLRWHPALRRRGAQARAESAVRAAHASASLAGARWPLASVREAVAGVRPFPHDPSGATVHGAVRAVAAAQRLEPTWASAPLQAVAGLHTAACADLLPADQLGRPRSGTQLAGDGADLVDRHGRAVAAVPVEDLAARLATLTDLLTAPADLPALVVAALAHAEVAVVRPFVAGNGVVARALCRMVVTARGLDPTGVAVWEAALVAAGTAYPKALVEYATEPDGVVRWLTFFADMVVAGADEGRRAADAVLTGRTS
jgi:hypothetical protein